MFDLLFHFVWLVCEWEENEKEAKSLFSSNKQL